MDMNYYKDYINLGLNIAYYRKLNGYTQLEFAELLDINRVHMSTIESAKAGVSLDIVFRAAGVLKVPANKLFESRD